MKRTPRGVESETEKVRELAETRNKKRNKKVLDNKNWDANIRNVAKKSG